MKAERRHQLQQNSLSLALLDLPETLKQHSSTILLCISALFLVFALFYYRTTMKSQGQVQAIQSLAVARDAIAQVQSSVNYNPEGYIATRRQSGADAESALNQLASSTTDPHVLAEGLVARGDLYWELANTAEVPGATTRPSLRLDKSAGDYLAAATDAYTEVLTKYPDNRLAAVAAHLGLGAIAENNHNFDAARKEYDAVSTDTANPIGIARYAQARLAQLPFLQTPVRIGTEAPSTQPAATSRPAAAATAPIAH